MFYLILVVCICCMLMAQCILVDVMLNKLIAASKREWRVILFTGFSLNQAFVSAMFLILYIFEKYLT